eukprot:TRINITY_DN6787_c0_g2_i1.p1 TRINITY_DN6787_c0_g2~~TRINITY_DN6787_c0_g2_i1.p1  ORF type:complete len:1214 (-),score=387.99 TRINITY_DN6787_c0_g2_i1:330-3971(-)
MDSVQSILKQLDLISNTTRREVWDKIISPSERNTLSDDHIDNFLMILHTHCMGALKKIGSHNMDDKGDITLICHMMEQCIFHYCSSLNRDYTSFLSNDTEIWFPSVLVNMIRPYALCLFSEVDEFDCQDKLFRGFCAMMECPVMPWSFVPFPPSIDNLKKTCSSFRSFLIYHSPDVHNIMEEAHETYEFLLPIHWCYLLFEGLDPDKLLVLWDLLLLSQDSLFGSSILLLALKAHKNELSDTTATGEIAAIMDSLIEWLNKQDIGKLYGEHVTMLESTPDTLLQEMRSCLVRTDIEKNDLRFKVQRFYQHMNPARLDSVDELVKKYADKPVDLAAKFQAKYGCSFDPTGAFIPDTYDDNTKAMLAAELQNGDDDTQKQQQQQILDSDDDSDEVVMFSKEEETGDDDIEGTVSLGNEVEIMPPPEHTLLERVVRVIPRTVQWGLAQTLLQEKEKQKEQQKEEEVADASKREEDEKEKKETLEHMQKWVVLDCRPGHQLVVTPEIFDDWANPLPNNESPSALSDLDSSEKPETVDMVEFMKPVVPSAPEVKIVSGGGVTVVDNRSLQSMNSVMEDFCIGELEEEDTLLQDSDISMDSPHNDGELNENNEENDDENDKVTNEVKYENEAKEDGDDGDDDVEKKRPSETAEVDNVDKEEALPNTEKLEDNKEDNTENNNNNDDGIVIDNEQQENTEKFADKSGNDDKEVEDEEEKDNEEQEKTETDVGELSGLDAINQVIKDYHGWHVCVMGQETPFWWFNPSQQSQIHLQTPREDDDRENVLFLLRTLIAAEMPYVSILEGGFKGLRFLSGPGSPDNTPPPSECNSVAAPSQMLPSITLQSLLSAGGESAAGVGTKLRSFTKKAVSATHTSGAKWFSSLKKSAASKMKRQKENDQKIIVEVTNETSTTTVEEEPKIVGVTDEPIDDSASDISKLLNDNMDQNNKNEKDKENNEENDKHHHRHDVDGDEINDVTLKKDNKETSSTVSTDTIKSTTGKTESTSHKLLGRISRFGRGLRRRSESHPEVPTPSTDGGDEVINTNKTVTTKPSIPVETTIGPQTFTSVEELSGAKKYDYIDLSKGLKITPSVHLFKFTKKRKVFGFKKDTLRYFMITPEYLFTLSPDDRMLNMLIIKSIRTAGDVVKVRIPTRKQPDNICLILRKTNSIVLNDVTEKPCTVPDSQTFLKYLRDFVATGRRRERVSKAVNEEKENIKTTVIG